MTLRLRNSLAFLAACVVGVGDAPRASGEPLEFARLRDEERVLAATRVASMCGLGRCPAALLWSEASAPAFAAAFARLMPPKADKLDLSPWLIEDEAKMASLQENSSEYAACIHALVTAHRVSLSELGRAARRDLTVAHLSEEPAKYRGEVVRVMGKMRRIRRFDPPALAAKEGVRDLYEGWVFDEAAYGAHPVCLLFTELPDGMEVGDSVNYPAAFDGYFFKRYRYDGADGRRRVAPLLIGRAPILARHAPASAEEGLAHGTSLVMGFLGLLAGTLLLALGLAWWYQRGDRQIRARLEAARSRTVVNPFGEQ